MRDIRKLLDYEAKRNPTLCSMLDNIEEYTKEEIEAERFPKWIRLHLFKLKEVGAVQQHLMDSGIFERIENGFVPDTSGLVYEWTGEEFYVNISGNRGKMLLREGDLVFFPETGGMWIDTTFSSVIDRRLSTARRIGKRTKTEYRVDFQAMLQRRYAAHNLPIIDLTTGAKPAAGYGADVGVTASGIKFAIGRH